MRDTSLYIARIKNLKLHISTTDEIIDRLNKSISANKVYIGILEEDVDNLMIEREILIGENESLKKKGKLYKIILLISGGYILSTIL